MAYEKKGKGRPKKENEVRTVEWFSAKKNMIKLEGDESGSFLSEAVVKASNFEKYPINSGDVVEVAKGKDEEGDTVVTFLRKKKGETASTPKSEPKEETPTSSNAEVRTVKIIAVRKDKTAVKIDDGTWPKVKDTLQNHEAIKAGTEVEVKIVNDVIVAIKTDSVKKEEPKEERQTSSKSTGNSIDRQSAVKSASEIVKALIEQNRVTNVEDAKKALVELSTEAKKLIVE